MAFVKLDCGILDSTLWIERECREVFITALLMARPREFTEPIPQISVRAITDTGWQAAPGWYGFVEAAGPGIIRRAGVDLEAGMAALERLGSPDIESRTPDHEGRRMIRIDGGYLILNFDRYRQKDHTAAERARRYRDKKSQRDELPSRRDNTVTGRSVTQAEAEAEADKTLTPLSGKPDGGRKRANAERQSEALQYLDFLNAKAGKHFRPVPANLRLIEARLAEGVSLQDLKTLTVRKCREWLGTDQEKFLRPETLCNATKCNSYLGEITPEAPCNAPLATEHSSPQPSPAIADGVPPINLESQPLH